VNEEEKTSIWNSSHPEIIAIDLVCVSFTFFLGILCFLQTQKQAEKLIFEVQSHGAPLQLGMISLAA
jgi:hypothetical protein